MMRTWLNPVLELMTAEHRAMAFDLFCDWRACRLLRGFFFLCLRVKDSSVYQLTPARILHILTCFTCLFARMITLSFSTLTWSKQTRAWVCTQRNHNGGEFAERRLGGGKGEWLAGRSWVSPGMSAGCPDPGSPRCLRSQRWNKLRATDSARVPLTAHLETSKRGQEICWIRIILCVV